ncbi:MAG: hypothetical protein ACI4E5_13110 [Suilimivivens sp.]
MENFGYGTHFIYKGTEYCVIGTDCSRNEIECQTIPDDNNFYWFKVTGKNKVRLLG